MSYSTSNLPPWFREVVRLRRLTEREAWFAVSRGEWWLGVLLLGGMTAGLASGGLAEYWYWVVACMAPLLLFFLYKGLRRSDLRIDLDARTYVRKDGLWPAPWATAGTLDDLVAIRLQGLWIEYTGNRHPEIWIDLVFRTWEVTVAWTRWSQELTYRQMADLAEALRVDVIQPSGEKVPWKDFLTGVVKKEKQKAELAPADPPDKACRETTPAVAALLDRQGDRRDVQQQPAEAAGPRPRIGRPPSGSGLVIDGFPGHRVVLLPPAVLFESRQATDVFAPLAVAQVMWLAVPIFSVPVRIAVAAVAVLGLLVVFFGKWKRRRIEQHGHFLHLSYDLLGRNWHQAFVHRDAVADLEVRRPNPVSPNETVLPCDRVLVIRTTSQRFFYLGRHLDPGALEWLRKAVLEMLFEMKAAPSDD